MDFLVYFLARTLVTVIQALPLTVVARLGRAAGALAYGLDVRHRRVAVKNLTRCFGHEKSSYEIRALARENFKRIGECYLTAIKSAAMTLEELQPHLTFTGQHLVTLQTPGQPSRNFVGAVGHFGNFELYSRMSKVLSGYRTATTYRGLRPPSLNRLMQSLREKSGCLYFERRTQGRALREFMSQPNAALGFLADQRTAVASVRLPFLGHECTTTAAPAVFAKRYHAALHVCICYRVGLAQWRIEISPEIPTLEQGHPRSNSAIMRDVNLVLEAAVRRDPANWFWVHDRWKLPQSAPTESDARETQWETVTQ